MELKLQQDLNQNYKNNMKNPSQLGANAMWDGPLSEEGRATSPGNSRNNMQVLKYPCKTSPINMPISSIAKGQ
tara:strand:+ start:635 stop:853 length:219 start_codon:yes stop_codon:yes gene_type:complete